MDDLNAQQIVLLTLLVSFVTSIATGIVTVSLLEQAPDPVTQTINRVVEKTIERVVSEPTDSKETIIEKEIVTVVVNEEELTIEAVEKNSRSLARIYVQGESSKIFIKLGSVINSAGEIVTDGSQIQDGVQYVAVYKSGEYPVSLQRRSEKGSLVILSISESEEVVNPRDFRAATLANSDSLKLGQSVISLSGQDQDSVSTGIINNFTTDSETEKINRISTSVSVGNVLLGSVILNLQGEIIGLRLNYGADEPTSFLPVNMLKSFLTEPEPVEETTA